jgi:hypothetical protein
VEGVVNALERVHKALVGGGLLLDMHPVPPAARAVGPGGDLGAFEEGEFFDVVHATEQGLDAVVRRGLFVPEAETRFPSRETFDTPAELLETVAGWEGFRTPAALERRIRQAGTPLDITETVVLRRFRAAR